MSAASLECALRAMADTPRMVAMTIDDLDSKSCRELREASELVLVLARLLTGKTVHEAFGAPGDWGYETTIGQSLYQLYSSGALGAARLFEPAAEQVAS
jgi:hypothetical protein